MRPKPFTSQMAPLHIAICEDIPSDGAFLIHQIKQTNYPIEITLFETGTAFLQAFEKGMYHLIYLDIYLQAMNGMDIAASIRKLDPFVPIAFATSSPDHALEANRFQAILYMEKPVTLDTVLHTISVADAMRQRRKRDVLAVVDDGRRHLDIPFDEICFIDVLDHRCTLHLLSGDAVRLRTVTTMDELAARLPASHFYRCHRAFIVNFDEVVEAHEDFLMSTGDTVYIRVRDLQKTKIAYENYLFTKTRERHRR